MYDLIIRNGTLVDGPGWAGYHAALAVQDGRIAEIGDVSGGAKRELDADGHVVTPGLIDGHDDELALMRRELEDALAADALGFAMSRGEGHFTSDDRPVASRMADWDELIAFGANKDLSRPG